MKRLDGLESPGLAFLAFIFRPHNGLPMGSQDQSGAGIGDLHAIATGLVDIEKKRLLYGVFVWPGFDEDAVLEKNVRGAQNILAGIDGVGDVVEAAPRLGMVARVGKIVALVADRQPHPRFRSIIHHDLLGEAAAKIFLEEDSVGLYV